MFNQVNAVRAFSRAFASKVHRLIISGAPASGKGTQCEKIIEEFKVPHLSTGDMLRAAVKAGSPLGKEAKAYMDAGKLVPDSLVINLVKEKLATPECVNGGWLLDGFPRTGEQAKALQQANINPDKVVLLDVPDIALIERVTGRRTDPETGTTPSSRCVDCKFHCSSLLLLCACVPLCSPILRIDLPHEVQAPPRQHSCPPHPAL
jgi:adenylate kinase